MKYLTFLDFEQLQVTGKNVELRLAEKDREIAYLRETGLENKEIMTSMSDRLIKLTQQVEALERQSKR
jgi:hypothetical protein